MNLSEIEKNIEKLSLEEYNQLFEILFREQEKRFGDVLYDSMYHGEMPTLPKYQISRVPIEVWRPYRECFLC